MYIKTFHIFTFLKGVDMENIIYEYKHDKRRDLYCFEGKSTNAPRHFHRTIEILYVLEGVIECTVGNEHFFAKEDDIIFVHNYYVHSFTPSPSYRKYVVIISSEHERDIDKILKSTTLSPLLSDKDFNRKNLRHIFDRIIGEKESMPSLVKKGYANVVFGTLLEHYEPVVPKTREIWNLWWIFSAILTSITASASPSNRSHRCSDITSAIFQGFSTTASARAFRITLTSCA